MKSIILIQPREGVYNKLMKPWLPLSLLSAVTKLDKEGYPIKIIDQRVNNEWGKELVKALAEDPLCVGITSMTGYQILGAVEASKIVKKHSKTPVIWGGVHSTLFPHQTIENSFIDIVVKNEGEETFYGLVKRLEMGNSLDNLPGILYKQNGGIKENPDRPFIDLNELPSTPYHLVNIKDYQHKYFNEKEVVEVESSRGCPFNCTFCYNPLYNKRTWRAFSAASVVEEVKNLVKDYSIKSIQFIDDGFFINKKRVREIMQGIIDEKLNVVLGFQGVRIDTFDKMSDEEIALVDKAGGRYLQFGVESGSPRILELINKKIKVEQVIALNRRLAKHPRFIPHYNFMCGFPTETREDLFQTTSLAWTILRDNKKATISPFHHYKPYPGTALREKVINKNHVTPQSLEEWGRFDWTEFLQQDHDKDTMRLMENVEMTSILVDRKMENQTDSAFWIFATKLYRPIARFRLKNNFYSIMPESSLMKFFKNN